MKKHLPHPLAKRSQQFYNRGQMIRIKNQTHIFGLISVIVLLLGLTLAAPPKVSAVLEEPCPDSYSARFDNDPNTGIGTYSEVCEDHQTGTRAADSTETTAPGCYILSGGTRTSTTCPASLGADPNKCYKANAGSSGISEFTEFNCGGTNETGDPTQGANLDAQCDEDSNGNGTNLDKEDCGIIGYVITFINILSALVGTVIVIMIAVGGIQYSMARDDPQAVSAAKTRIQNAIFALLVYLFGFAFLQWLVPGGVF